MGRAWALSVVLAAALPSTAAAQLDPLAVQTMALHFITKRAASVRAEPVGLWVHAGILALASRGAGTVAAARYHRRAAGWGGQLELREYETRSASVQAVWQRPFSSFRSRRAATALRLGLGADYGFRARPEPSASLSASRIFWNVLSFELCLHQRGAGRRASSELSVAAGYRIW